MKNKILSFILMTSLIITSLIIPVNAKNKNISLKTNKCTMQIDYLQNKNVKDLVKIRTSKNVKIRKITYKSANKKILNISKNKIKVKKTGKATINIKVKYKKNKKIKTQQLKFNIKVVKSINAKPVNTPTIKPSTGSAITKPSAPSKPMVTQNPTKQPNTTNKPATSVTPNPTTTTTPKTPATYYKTCIKLFYENGDSASGYIYVDGQKIYVNHYYIINTIDNKPDITAENGIDSDLNSASSSMTRDDDGNTYVQEYISQVIQRPITKTVYSAHIEYKTKDGKSISGIAKVNGKEVYVDKTGYDINNSNDDLSFEFSNIKYNAGRFTPQGHKAIDIKDGTMYVHYYFLQITNYDYTQNEISDMFKKSVFNGDSSGYAAKPFQTNYITNSGNLYSVTLTMYFDQDKHFVGYGPSFSPVLIENKWSPGYNLSY